VAFLAAFATDGTALELAVGTGRIALPLGRHGVQVDGIELSADMVARLREKDDGDQINVVIGHMAATTAPRSSYSLVYLVYNTVYNLLTQDDQVRCFENAARHLGSNGVFVVEAGVPWAWVRGDQFVNVERLTVDQVTLDSQALQSRHPDP
jgi:SAM-dependent methyltransferase